MAVKRSFAHGTKVDADSSRLEIQKLVKRLNATQFLYGYDEGREIIMFQVNGRRVRFELPIPDKADNAEIMRLWRGLVHRIKSKVITVEEGIAEFDEEFLSEIVLPSGETYGQFARPQLKMVYESQHMPALLPGAE